MENKIEVWKDIFGYQGLYQVSNYGNVKSLNYRRTKKAKNLKPAISIKTGYLSVVLCKNKIHKTYTIHQLIAIAFLNHTPCSFKFVVNHKNLNKLDNSIENLEIITSRENSNLKHIKSSSRFTGVSWSNHTNKWESSIYIDGKSVKLGYFINELDAHNAYQKKLNEIKK